MAAIKFFVVFSCMVLGSLILGFHNILTSVEENGCEMTYMFEYPQYVKIALPTNVSPQYQRYGLYAYGEGQATEKLRHMKFNGIPVLFIPGNGGSHKQVRSLASVSLRKAISSHVPFHLDFFAIDFNEEYSALFGGVLKEQTDFLKHCIHQILKLYEGKVSRPNSVILIGHSMGGLVARGLFLLPDFDRGLVKVVITLVTPHLAPAVSTDPHLIYYYQCLKDFWNKNRKELLSHVTFASIGGGHRDYLVRSDLTHLHEADVNALTTNIPTVWLSTDHVCSIWCKQLVLVIVRSLFDIIDLKTMQLSEDVSLRNRVFNYHLVKRTAGKRFSTAEHIQKITLEKDANWEEFLTRQFSVPSQPNEHQRTHHIMVRLLDDPKHRFLAAVANNFVAKDWIFVCRANVVSGNSRICEFATNLSNETQFLPTTKDYNRENKRKYALIDLAALKKKLFTHVVLRVQSSSLAVQLHVDVHSTGRQIPVSLPRMLSAAYHNIIQRTDKNSLYYELLLPGFENVWQAYLLQLRPLKCQYLFHEATATLSVPWSNEGVYVTVTDKSAPLLKLVLQTPKPASYQGSSPVKVQMILDPLCTYSVSIKSSPLDSLGQLARFYSTFLPAYIAVVSLLALRYQLQCLSNSEKCVMFHTALAAGAKPYFILPVAKIVSRLLSLEQLTKYTSLPTSDAGVLLEMGLDFLLLPLFLYMCAFAIVYILSIVCWLCMIFSGQTAHKMALRFLARTITCSITWSEWVLSGISHLPVSVAALLVGLAINTCGSLALCVGLFFFFLKITKMYEDYLEEFVMSSLKFIAKKLASKWKPSVKKPSIAEDQSGGVKQANTNSNNDGNTGTSGGDISKDTKTNLVSEGGDTSRSNQPEENAQTSTDNEQDVLTASNTSVMAQDKEKVDKNNRSSSSLSDINFSFTIFVLWCIVTAFNVPNVLFWAHNYRYSSKLDPDPSLLSSIILCACAAVLWQQSGPKPNLKHYKVIADIIFGLAVVTLCYCTLSIYLLSPLITIALVLVTAHQLLGEVGMKLLNC